jgi:hypothetical protein
MKLEPASIASDDPIKKLSTVQRRCYYLAVVTAFVSIFVWAIKILFF